MSDEPLQYILSKEEWDYFKSCEAELAAKGEPVATHLLAIYNQINAANVAQSQAPVAWLWKLKKPGKFVTYATVDSDSTEHWPIDEWTKIESFPLYTAAPIPDAANGEPIAVVGLSAEIYTGSQFHELTKVPPRPEVMMFKPLPVGTQLYAAPQDVPDGYVMVSKDAPLPAEQVKETKK